MGGSGLSAPFWGICVHCWAAAPLRTGAGTQECTQIGQNGPSALFWDVCVHCWAVGLGCEWPWDRNSVHKWEDRASWSRFGAFVYTVGLLRCCGQPWGRNSVHRSAKTASPRRFGSFVYTVATRVATRVAIRIATRAASGGTSASAAMACRRLLLAGPSRLVGKTGSERVAPLPGWHLRRGVNPHEPPKSHLNVVFDYRICPSLRHGLTRPKMCCPFVERGHRSHAYQRHTPPHQ